jgi:hypothetical protein
VITSVFLASSSPASNTTRCSPCQRRNVPGAIPGLVRREIPTPFRGIDLEVARLLSGRAGLLTTAAAGGEIGGSGDIAPDSWIPSASLPFPARRTSLAGGENSADEGQKA